MNQSTGKSRARSTQCRHPPEGPAIEDMKGKLPEGSPPVLGFFGPLLKGPRPRL